MKPIVRVWRGWTPPGRADEFEARVRGHWQTLSSTRGLVSLQLLRRDGADESEFVTITRFETMEDVIRFAGPDFARAVIPEPLRPIISRVDEEVRHYELAFCP